MSHGSKDTVFDPWCREDRDAVVKTVRNVLTVPEIFRSGWGGRGMWMQYVVGTQPYARFASWCRRLGNWVSPNRFRSHLVFRFYFTTLYVGYNTLGQKHSHKSGENCLEVLQISKKILGPRIPTCSKPPSNFRFYLWHEWINAYFQATSEETRHEGDE